MPVSKTLENPIARVLAPAEGADWGRVNVFIAHSPFQRLIANHMVQSMEEFASADNYLILDSLDEGDTPLSGRWNETLVLDPPVGGSVVGAGRNCRSALKLIEDICSEYDTVFLFRANLEWPLNNAMIGSRLHRSVSKIVLCNFPEGIGSLVYNLPGLKQQIKTGIKHLLGLVGGVPFYSYPGDIMGLEYSNRIYSLLPDAINRGGDKRVVQIPVVRPLSDNALSGTCLFIGQNYDHYGPAESFAELCTRAASYASSLGFETLLYKPHHYDISGMERRIFERYGFSLLDDNRAIEEIFLRNQYACAVSYASSALVHLKMMFSDRVRCIACFSAQTLNIVGVDSKPYRDLFELCGVELYD